MNEQANLIVSSFDYVVSPVLTKSFGGSKHINFVGKSV